MLESWPDPAVENAAGKTMVRFPPDGRFARVDDDAAQLREHLLNTGSGVFKVTRLRRLGRLVDLPSPRPRTTYVVSRVTAFAARDRSDLVFPFREIRDSDGRVAGVQGLASFRPRRRFWRFPARPDRRSRALGRPWLTGVLFATATAFLSATLGLFPSSLDTAKASGWSFAWTTWTLRLSIAFAVAGLGLLVAAAWRWHDRGRVLDERGTAYVIEEHAITWRHEEKASVLADVSSGFAAVLRVPGPGELGDDWHWQADGNAASQWDARVDQLVGSFWAVHYNDDQVTRNAVFIWAPWPVAMAFGARATARRRGLVLHVRQRPSHGAGGPYRRPRLTGGAHDFLRYEGLPSLSEVAPGHEPAMASEQVELTLAPMSPPHASERGPMSRRHGGRSHPDGAGGVLLLVVRVTHGPVGPIPVDLAATGPLVISVAPSLAEHVLPVGPRTVPVVEWRLDPRETGASRVPELPWPAFPAAAEAIADWVLAQAAAYAARVVLLAARIPQELAVGLGVQLGQRSWERKPGQQWPQQVYPVFHTGSRLVVPGLRLGADSVPAQRVPGG